VANVISLSLFRLRGRLLNLSNILYTVSEQLNFPRWGCQPHAQPPAILEDRCFLSGLSPLAD
jgi:hypothetical protein